ncbi:hypothetical protein [Baekduia alba]|uniref:hypothetical protein n=1 Tax=Baekduia alba TaxID=2997333 RepID=UPI002340F918|nr:hypothetical protein [Baekduia alba]
MYTTEVPNANYRAVWPAEALRARGGHQVQMLEYDLRRKLRYDQLFSCDVVHVYRRADRGVIKCVDDLRARGVAITYDNDDDIRLAPKEAETYKAIGGAKGELDFRGQTHMMRRAHILTTTSQGLASRWACECDCPIEVVPNYLSPIQFVDGPRNKEGVVIGWCAAAEHAADAKRLRITEVLRRVMQRCPHVRVVTIGIRLELDGNRYVHHRYVPHHDLGRVVRAFDIGLAPLADIPMAYTRSDVKVKEYAAAGVPWMASARGPYADLGPKQGGLAVGDDAWEDTLVALAASKFKRSQLRRRGEKWGKSQDIARNVERWEAVWERAVALAAAQRPTQAGRVAGLR